MTAYPANIILRPELRQGQTGVLKVIVRNGLDVGICHRHHRMANWTIAAGIGNQAVPLARGITTFDLSRTVGLLFTDRTDQEAFAALAADFAASEQVED